MAGTAILGPPRSCVFPRRGLRQLRAFPALGRDRAGSAVCCADRGLLHPAQAPPQCRDLFLPAGQSPYRYWHGVNYVAFASVAVGAVTYSLLLNPVTYEPSELFRYTTASVPAVVMAGVTHYVLTRTVVQRLGMGGYS